MKGRILMNQLTFSDMEYSNCKKKTKREEQMQFYHSSFVKSSNVNDFNDKVERLVHEVRMERPGFKSEIRAEDIRDVVVCIPARKNRRIDNQEGAFIVCGLLEEIDDVADYIKTHVNILT